MNPTKYNKDLKELITTQKSKLVIDETYEFNTKLENIFSIIGNLEGITRFFPLIYKASVENKGDSVGEESIRVCSIRGMGKVREEIVWWSNPEGFAYRASGTFVPLKDHLGVISLSSNDRGGTTLTWQQYFNTRFGPLGWMFPFMMKILMKKAINNIKKML